MNSGFDHAPKENGSQKRTAEKGPGVSKPSKILVHARLEMTHPGDSDEREADEVADSIIAGGKIARAVGTGQSGSGIALPSHFGSQLASFQGQGSRLYGDLKNRMETGFGRDFSSVRLHTDNAAAEMSSSISARAFTYGNDIYFNRGQFNPDTHDGQHLLAHELTHVVQGSGKVERKHAPEYLQSTEAMINHLIDTASTTHGYHERLSEQYAFDTVFSPKNQSEETKKIIDEVRECWNSREKKRKEINKAKHDKKAQSVMDQKLEEKRVIDENLKALIGKLNSNSSWDDIWRFILERTFVLTGGLSDTLLRNSLQKSIADNEERDSKKEEEALVVLKRVFLRIQSGVPIPKALEAEERDIQTLNLEGLINEDFIESIQVVGARNRDAAILTNAIQTKEKTIKDLKKKGKSREKEKLKLEKIVSIMNQIVAELGNDTSFEDALANQQQQMEETGDSEVEKVIETIRSVVVEGRSKQEEASLAVALKKERKFMLAQGMDDDEIDQAIDSKLMKIISDPLLCKIIFDDPNNSVFIDPEGEQNHTMFHYQLGEGMGASAQWCDHFVHWCFLRAFYPISEDGWKTKEEKDEIRDMILHYAMGEHGSTSGNVRGTIRYFNEHDKNDNTGKRGTFDEDDAFIDSKFDTAEIDNNFGIHFRDNTFPDFQPDSFTVDGVTFEFKEKKKIQGMIKEIKEKQIPEELKTKAILTLKIQYLEAFNATDERTNLLNKSKQEKEDKKKQVDAIKKKKVDDRTEEEKQLVDEFDKEPSSYDEAVEDVKDYEKTKNKDNREKWVDYAELYLQMVQNKKRLDSTKDGDPRPGDVFFKVGHIGLVVGVKNEKTIQTVEGNTNEAGSSTGSSALRKERPRKTVLGYAHPNYDGLRRYLAKHYGVTLKEEPKAPSAGAPQVAPAPGTPQVAPSSVISSQSVPLDAYYSSPPYSMFPK